MPILSFESEIYASLNAQGLSEWWLRIEGVPLRGLEWFGQYPCLVQDVTESHALAPEASMLEMCRSTFGLKESHSFVRFGGRYQVRRGSFQIEVTLSRLKKIHDKNESSLVSDNHYLVELSVQTQQTELKGAAKALHEWMSLLHPWVVPTVS